VDLEIQTTQNTYTQAAPRPSSNPHRFRDIKAYLQCFDHFIYYKYEKRRYQGVGRKNINGNGI